jgi:hypothetical protein
MGSQWPSQEKAPKNKTDLSAWALDTILAFFHSFLLFFSIFPQIKALFNRIGTCVAQETEIYNLFASCLDLYPAHLTPC